jgi:hypothetical protein
MPGSPVLSKGMSLPSRKAVNYGLTLPVHGAHRPKVIDFALRTRSFNAFCAWPITRKKGPKASNM